MRLLLDTHIAVWAISDPKKLGDETCQLIEKSGGDVMVSAVVIWEIAIKFALRRGRRSEMPFSAYDAIEKFDEAGFESLYVEPLHAAAVGGLPMLHQDPFDRLLVAQALVERMTLLTHDRQLAAYGNFVMLAQCSN